jgi:hypothetical protein
MQDPEEPQSNLGMSDECFISALGKSEDQWSRRASTRPINAAQRCDRAVQDTDVTNIQPQLRQMAALTRESSNAQVTKVVLDDYWLRCSAVTPRQTSLDSKVGEGIPMVGGAMWISRSILNR